MSLRGILALCTRSLRIDARLMLQHLSRLIVLAVVYCGLQMLLTEANRFGAPGLWFFGEMAWINFILVILFGCGQFANVITEEKEDGTLGLMMLTALSPLAILLGKVTSRLTQFLLLIAVQFPFTLLSITLGGVTLDQIVASFAGLVAFVLALAGFGLLCSVLFSRTQHATTVTLVVAIGYAICSPFALAMVDSLKRYGHPYIPVPLQPYVISVLEVIPHLTYPFQLWRILQIRGSVEWLTLQVVSNVAFGGACLLLSWKLFPWATRDSGTEPVVRRLSGAASKLVGTSTRRLNLVPRAWNHPVVWQAFFFDQGGYPIVLVKILGYLALFGLVVGFQSEGLQYQINWQRDVIPTYLAFMTALLLLEFLLQTGRLFHPELRAGTWTTLLLVPRPLPYLAYSKVIGTLLTMLPGAVITGSLWLFFFSQWSPNERERMLTAGAFWLMVATYFALASWLAWLSTYLQQSQQMLRLFYSVCAVAICVLVLRQLWYPTINAGTPPVELWCYVPIGLLLSSIVLTQWMAMRQLARGEG